jgi:hypothetical protein
MYQLFSQQTSLLAHVLQHVWLEMADGIPYNMVLIWNTSHMDNAILTINNHFPDIGMTSTAAVMVNPNRIFR